MPPFSMRRFVGESRFDIQGRDFKATGEHFLQKLQTDAGLTAADRVLDLGSGCGRIAIPLTRILLQGLYRGLDVNRPLVQWCQRKITSRYPAFQFIHSDVHTELYNPRGSVTAAEYSFPFSNGQFDLAIATSLFTHLLPVAVERYFRECSRVLAVGGRLFATFFLVDNGKSSADGGLRFDQSFDAVSLVVDPQHPQKAIAFKAEWIIEVAARVGLEPQFPLRWGFWTGRNDGYSFQDVIIFSKRN